MITTKILADSRNVATGDRLTTYQLTYPLRIHNQILTHRALSRCSASSRAIPVNTYVKEILDNPAYPHEWRKEQKGMQGDERFTPIEEYELEGVFDRALQAMLPFVFELTGRGVHKQHVNGLLAPFVHISTVLSGTEWRNFFKLRAHHDVYPDLKHLAEQMLQAYEGSIPAECEPGFWHLPYCDQGVEGIHYDLLPKIAAARCARVSYQLHGENQYSTPMKDQALYEKLVGAEPIHASPLEHPAKALGRRMRVGNYVGFIQLRKMLEHESGGDYEGVSDN